MAIHVKTTLNINDPVMTCLREEAAQTGRTMSELVETALRLLLQARRGASRLKLLPTFDGAGGLVDIADREALSAAIGAADCATREDAMAMAAIQRVVR
jgi:hypothetical protein